MAHTTGAKGKINRRLGAMIFENNGARKAFERRPDAMPGMHARRGKLSGYGQSMLEKQKIKQFYGLSERQLRRIYAEASRLPGNTGERLLNLCEMRLDNIIRRAGFTLTRPQARQGVGHGHFVVNGMKCDVASRILKPGDVIYVKPRVELQKLYRDITAQDSGMIAPFLSVDAEKLTIRVERTPMPEEFSLPVDAARVVELLTR